MNWLHAFTEKITSLDIHHFTIHIEQIQCHSILVLTIYNTLHQRLMNHWINQTPKYAISSPQSPIASRYKIYFLNVALRSPLIGGAFLAPLSPSSPVFA